MKLSLVTVAAGLIVGVILFDIAPESVETIGLVATLCLLLAGAFASLELRFNKHHSKNALVSPLSLAFWFHSLLEGALVATSLRIDPQLGYLVLAGVLLHLIPEILAITTLLYYQGLSLKQSLLISMITLGALITGFAVVKLLPVSETSLQVMATASAGVMLGLSVNIVYQQFRNHNGAYV